MTPRPEENKGRGGCSLVFRLRNQTQPMAQAQATSRPATTNITITESSKPFEPSLLPFRLSVSPVFGETVGGGGGGGGGVGDTSGLGSGEAASERRIPSLLLESR